MPDPSRPIGVFDSGVGGLTVFRALRERLPGERLLYLGDTARVPYGTKSAETVRRFALQAGRWLAGHDVKAIVVACNSASAVSIDLLREQLALPVFGVIGPGARAAVNCTRSGKIGVLATRGTILSGAYPKAIHALAPEAKVFSAAAPLFVPLAEEGWQDHPVAEQVAAEYLAPLLAERVDTLVLGCTHYPLLKNTLARVAGEGVALVDSAEATSTEIVDRLKREKLLNSAGVDAPIEHGLFVTDRPEPFQAVAERFLGTTHTLQQVSIEGDY